MSDDLNVEQFQQSKEIIIILTQNLTATHMLPVDCSDCLRHRAVMQFNDVYKRKQAINSYFIANLCVSGADNVI